MSTPSHEEIRKEFENTDIKLATLARKYGLKYDTLKSIARRQEWKKGAPENEKGAPENDEKGAPESEQVHPSDGKKRRRGAPPGNKNAVGNRGGGAPQGNQNAVGNSGGAPPRNRNAVTHGLFSKFLPDDPDTHEIIQKIHELSEADLIWSSIEILYTNLIRSLRIMFVQDKDDMTKEVVRSKRVLGDMESEEEEFEIQFAWDKHGNTMAAQARVTAELRNLIKDFLIVAGEDDERRKKLQLMQAQIDRTNLEIEKLKSGEGGSDAPQIIDDIGDGGGSVAAD